MEQLRFKIQKDQEGSRRAASALPGSVPAPGPAARMKCPASPRRIAERGKLDQEKPKQEPLGIGDSRKLAHSPNFLLRKRIHLHTYTPRGTHTYTHTF